MHCEQARRWSAALVGVRALNRKGSQGAVVDNGK
jgi:hypothetical protein